MIGRVVGDVIIATRARIAAASPASIDEVRTQPAPLAAMSEAVYAAHTELKQFLNTNLYRHSRVLRMTEQSRRMLRELFEALLTDIDLLPAEHQRAARDAEAAGGRAGRARVVADYVAGMTDRFAILEHGRLFDPDAQP